MWGTYGYRQVAGFGLGFGLTSFFDLESIQSQHFGSIQLYFVNLKVYQWSSIIFETVNPPQRCGVHAGAAEERASGQFYFLIQDSFKVKTLGAYNYISFI